MERHLTNIRNKCGELRMNFQIMEQVGGKKFIPALDDERKPFIFPCPKQAAKKAAELEAIKGVKFQPRPMLESAEDWKARETQRFVSGEYKTVCWVGQDWWNKHFNADHFVHVAIKDPTRIAFTKNARDGARDIQTSMKPGKYLTEFFGKVLTTEQIKVFAMEHSTTFENKELKFATTPEDIERVYEPTLGYSCFSGTKKANLYGSGDFAVAYIESDGVIKARAVCCPARKIYVRSYGDNYRLEKLLHDAGYTKKYDRTSYKGLRLLTKFHWNGFYTDFGCYPEPKPNDKEFFVI